MAFSWLNVPTTRGSDLSGFSSKPFCISGFLQVRENWKMSRNLCCQGNDRENIIFEKSGKMILDHADC